jgi:hypothetical protein
MGRYSWTKFFVDVGIILQGYVCATKKRHINSTWQLQPGKGGGR